MDVYSENYWVSVLSTNYSSEDDFSVNLLLATHYYAFCRLGKLLRKRTSRRKKTSLDPKKDDGIIAEEEDNDFSVERIRLENMELR